MTFFSKPVDLITRLRVFFCPPIAFSPLAPLTAGFLFLCSCQPQSPPPGPPVEPTPTSPSPPLEKISAPSGKPPSQKDGYIGLSKEAAHQKAEAAGLRSRTVHEDGKDFMVTKDYRPQRLNFVIIKGIVTAVTKG